MFDKFTINTLKTLDINTLTLYLVESINKTAEAVINNNKQDAEYYYNLAVDIEYLIKKYKLGIYGKTNKN